jgi:SHS2 domain-containing protein
VELEIEAENEAGVFVEAMRAVGELLAEGPEGDPQVREIELEDSWRGSLLVGWLNELVALAEIDAFLPERAVSLSAEETRLRASVEGRRGEPRYLVKAATHSRLEFEQANGGWRARVVLDV